MNARFAAGIAATIVVGLVIDAQGRAWSQPVVDVVAWGMFAWLLASSPVDERRSYLLCLGLATVGEMFLSLTWGLYDYRLGNLPLFVPPGHVLLYAFGRWVAARFAYAAGRPACLVVLSLAGWLAWQGMDQLSAPLAMLFVLCMRFGPAPRLYAAMFVLALAMELLGTGLGNWTWRPQAPWLGWTTLNPPFAAGAFYCVLDMLVGRGMAWSARRSAAAAGAGLR